MFHQCLMLNMSRIEILSLHPKSSPHKLPMPLAEAAGIQTTSTGFPCAAPFIGEFSSWCYEVNPTESSSIFVNHDLSLLWLIKLPRDNQL